MSTPYTYEKLDQPEVLKHLFQPPKPSSAPAPENSEDITIVTDDDCELHLRAFGSDNKEAPVILFFHGHDEQVGDYTDIAPQFNKQLGTSFLVAGYRGYGLSSGTPSATAIIADSQLFFARALQWKKDNGYTGKVIVMGRDLGCAPAIELAMNNPKQIDALMVDSGFAFTLPVLKAMGIDTDALGLTEDDGFHHFEKAQELTLALYVIHMAMDEFIDMSNPSNLVSEAKSRQKQLQIVPGRTKTTIFDVTGDMYYEVMGRFVKNIGCIRKKKVGVR